MIARAEDSSGKEKEKSLEKKAESIIPNAFRTISKHGPKYLCGSFKLTEARTQRLGV
jgi:hypothetical protein